MADENAAAGAEQAQKSAELIKVYLKDASFEAPTAPGVFKKLGAPGENPPQTNIQVAASSNKMEGDLHDVSLHISVTLKQGEDTVFLCEIQQSGLFELKGFSDQELDQILSIFCPTTLFPYGREVVSSLTGKGGFPPLVMQPVNFEAMYAQRMQEAAAQAQQAE